MSEQLSGSLNHFTFFSFSEAYFNCDASERSRLNQRWLEALREIDPKVDIYQVYPTRSEVDFLVWLSVNNDYVMQPAEFFTDITSATGPFRRWFLPGAVFWGFTKPSQYSKTRSSQEIDPFAAERSPYLILYPFQKTSQWYLMGREARQGMMNEHIRIGKQYSSIKQLLLYSFGLQDQEFIVVYECDDLSQFSDLVYELRGSEARRYTERDTPIFTAVYHLPEETLQLWN